MVEFIEINDLIVKRKLNKKFVKSYRRTGHSVISNKEMLKMCFEREIEIEMVNQTTGEEINLVRIQKFLVWKENNLEKGFIRVIDARDRLIMEGVHPKNLERLGSMMPWIIMDIYVAPKYRSKGVAKRMLETFIDTHKVAAISMDPDVMKKNKRFYQDLGFTQQTMRLLNEGEVPNWIFHRSTRREEKAVTPFIPLAQHGYTNPRQSGPEITL
jgi:GNAT superfamily N-acetyltransferase